MRRGLLQYIVAGICMQRRVGDRGLVVHPIHDAKGVRVSQLAHGPGLKWRPVRHAALTSSWLCVRALFGAVANGLYRARVVASPNSCSATSSSLEPSSLRCERPLCPFRACSLRARRYWDKGSPSSGPSSALRASVQIAGPSDEGIRRICDVCSLDSGELLVSVGSRRKLFSRE